MELSDGVKREVGCRVGRDVTEVCRCGRITRCAGFA